MGFLKSLVKILIGSGRKVKTKKPKASRGNAVRRVPKEESQPKHYMAKDEALFNDNESVLNGVKFVATMQLRTPLNVLEHHGETFRGHYNNAPKYGTDADGVWVPWIKSWKELGINMKEFSPGTMASEFGPIPSDGGDCLLFLKDFRRIIESKDSVESQIEHIKQLPNLNPVYASYIGVAEKWFGIPSVYAPTISSVPGIGSKIMESLNAAGIHKIDDLKLATDDTLLKINGIGPSALAKIREHLKTV